MFKVNRAQHVLAVNDFDSAVKYFTEMLGFTLDRTIGGWSFLHLDQFYLMVGDCQGEVPARETNNHALFAYVNCEGIDELFDQYRERGVQFNQTIADKPWGLREFGVETPEGHRIMFGQEIQA
ncbi:VOC family protein [Maricaulis sp.]|uniref:VOC family protein n=1 Tax=Maricaulis sp. TaxID=1486257 RepID=UPI003A91FEF0